MPETDDGHRGRRARISAVTPPAKAMAAKAAASAKDVGASDRAKPGRAGAPRPARAQAAAPTQGAAGKKSAAPTRARASADAAPRPYHHGNLREALIEAAVAIIEEQGVEQLRVREAAKRAGVSPGAPFRHFASRTALLTAVAEQATERLATSAAQALADAADQPALQRLAAIGHAYLDWASAYPTHFRVISDRTQLEDGGSPATLQANEALRQAMRALLDEALGPQVSADERERALVASRAMVYGLARMAADGHLPEWQLPNADALATLHGVLDFFIASLAQRAG